jgi:hypothetical protein
MIIVMVTWGHERKTHKKERWSILDCQHATTSSGGGGGKLTQKHYTILSEEAATQAFALTSFMFVSSSMSPS